MKMIKPRLIMALSIAVIVALAVWAAGKRSAISLQDLGRERPPHSWMTPRWSATRADASWAKRSS